MTSSSAIKAAESQERYGAHYADGYDDRRFTTTEGAFAQAFELDLFRRTLRSYGAKRVLDVPIGTGRVAIPLANEFSIVGGDISPAMLAEGRGRAAKYGAGHINWLECSVDKMPFADGQFDAVVTARLFQHVPKNMGHVIVCELSRVVKRDGVVIVQFRSGLYGLVLKYAHYWIRRRGYADIRHKCIFPDQVPTLFAGHKIVGHYGYKFPLSGLLARIVGLKAVMAVERVLSAVPGIRWLGKYKTFVLQRA
jgi:ubiquinone/menaquinone biosynthesis C-methylase UbiE